MSDVPSYNELIHMMDVAEGEIEESAEQITKTTNNILNSGNCRDSCELNGIRTKTGFIARIRRKINGIE